MIGANNVIVSGYCYITPKGALLLQNAFKYVDETTLI